MDALSVDFTSFAKETGQEFPFVRLPDYDVRAANARVLGESYVINFFPLVKEVQREEWNRQTVDNPSFVNDFYNNEVAADTTQRLAQDQRFAEGERKLQEMPPRGISPVRPTPEGLYLPGIQFSPAIPDPTFIVNYDAYSAPEALDVYKTSVQTGRAALGPAFVDLSNENYNIYLNYLYSLSQYRDRAEKIAADPTSTLAYPVFDSFNVDDREVVGTLGLNLNWRTIFSRTLPSNVVGVYCIIQNTFNQTLSFIVDGSVVVYLGVGDMHEPAYNHMVQQESMNDYLANHVSKETRSYTSVGLDSNYSDFKLYVYPSSRMEGSFTDQSPLLFTLTIVGVFFFTSMLFVVYDFMVGRRQRTIMRQAVKSSELVSSLFPSQIRDQLYEQNEQKKRPVRGDDADDHDQVGMMERFSRQRKSPGSSKHIASLFENTTVMFADLAGFTAWCSKRAPEDVFHLLEALFSKFDAAAKRRRVFKVETIGMFAGPIATSFSTHCDALFQSSRRLLPCRDRPSGSATTPRCYVCQICPLMPSLYARCHPFSCRYVRPRHSRPRTADWASLWPCNVSSEAPTCTNISHAIFRVIRYRAGVLRSDRARFQLFGVSWSAALCVAFG